MSANNTDSFIKPDFVSAKSLYIYGTAGNFSEFTEFRFFDLRSGWMVFILITTVWQL